MRRPCPKVITCQGIGLQPEPDWPVTNYSAEAPDPLIWAGIVYPRVGMEPVGCFYSRTCPQYEAQDCWGIVYTAESQEQADALALAASINCPPPDPPGPNAQIYHNDAYTAVLHCANGTEFRYTVADGTMVSAPLDPFYGYAWQQMANEWARNYAIQRASELMACIDPVHRPNRTRNGPRLHDNPGWACLGDEADPEENTYTLTGAGSGEYVFTVSAGSLPPGLALVQDDPHSCRLEGFFTQAGNYDYTITATRVGLPTVSADVQDRYEVLGITNCEFIPDGKCDHAYNFQLEAAGGTAPYTFSLAPGYTLPTDITLDDAGLLSATSLTGYPQTVDTRIIVEDTNGHRCACDHTMRVTGPKFLPPWPGNGTKCSTYTSYQFTTSPAASTCAFSGTVPPGLTLGIHGLVTGVPTAAGSQNFVVMATDVDGNSNTFEPPRPEATITIDGAGDTCPRSPEDITTYPNPTGGWYRWGNSLPGGATASGAPYGGDADITITVPAGWSGTAYQYFRCFLRRCAALPAYSVQWRANTYFDRGGGVPTYNADLILFSAFPFQVVSGTANASGSGTQGSATSASPCDSSTGGNCEVRIQIQCPGISPMPHAGSIRIVVSFDKI